MQPGDREAREDAAALEAAVARRPTARALLRLAEVARDEDERRRTLERARDASAGEADPAARAMVLARLGDVARDQHRESVALLHWREALAADARCWPASLAIAEEQQSAGMPYLALAEIQALPPAARAIPRVERQLASLLDSVDRHIEAERLMNELALIRRRDVEIAHDLARRARARNDLGGIPRLVDAASVRPDLPGLTVDLARALEGAGRTADARQALEALAARLPDEPSAHAQLGKLLHRLGEREAALVELRRALELRPQDPELRRYTERAAVAREQDAGAPREDLARRYAADVAAMVAGQPLPASARAGAAARRRRRRIRRSSGWIGGSCACTATVWPRRSRSGWSRSRPIAAPRTTSSSTCATRRASRRSRSARLASSAAAPTERSRSSTPASATTRISPSRGTAFTTTTAPRSCASKACAPATCSRCSI